MDNKAIRIATCKKHGDYPVKELFCDLFGRSIILDKCPKCIEEFNEKFNKALDNKSEQKKPKYSFYNEQYLENKQ